MASTNTIVINSICPETKEEDLQRLFGLAGEIEKVVIDHETSSAKVVYKTADSAQKALLLNGALMNGSNVVVDMEHLPEKVITEEEVVQIASKWASLNDIVERLKSIDEKTHFTEYCVLCYILALSKSEDIYHNFHPIQSITNGLNHVDDKMNISGFICLCDDKIRELLRKFNPRQVPQVEQQVQTAPAEIQPKPVSA
ncbi:hypothetical protein EIN_229830 [Entamoeba invadens IP1]|uniref:RRM domain-containing protein n=1 Tax=Entamoeba invadens IP1 TaxID=370355 RepID=A0A0A1U6E1_ENTIV|nr:hypothetical protein EIN_229830 [Entamoeba invadens IP1]ELP88450.1 hypothetical protein EIN_229830 [Entamoeba invadens IP1]|eukprot:XP_004255221.1 hypothetical protein EIN_229830 [Entamoeba invadens IP1]